MRLLHLTRLALVVSLATGAGAVTFRCQTVGGSDGGGGAPGAPGSGVEEHRDLAYGKQHGRQKLDLYLPPSGDRNPVVLFIHGGGFAGGDKSSGRGYDQFVQQGWALASTNYALVKGGGGMGDIAKHGDTLTQGVADVRRAVRFLRKNARKYRLDPRRIAAFGVSAGGFYAAMLGATGHKGWKGDGGGGSPEVQAVVEFAGPTHFPAFAGHKFLYRQDPARQKFRYAPQEGFAFDISGYADDFLRQAGVPSVIENVTGKHPPTRIIHGHQDPVVPFEQSAMYRRALEKAGVTVEMDTLRGVGHEVSDEVKREQIEKAIRFLERHLR